MKARSCRVCGGAIGRGESNCPHCGTRVGTGVSRAWVLTFFVMGMALGLMLLILQQELPVWFSTDAAQSVPVKKPVRAVEQPRPQKVISKPKPISTPPSPIQPEQAVAHVPPPAVAESPTIEPMICDHQAAEAVRDKARTLSSITQQGDTVQLTLTRQWEYYSAGHRQSFVEAFAEADRCLYGRPRTIRFSYRGEEVALVSVEGAVVMK